MELQQIIGWCLVATPFIATIVVGLVFLGWRTMALVVLVCAAIFACVMGGGYLVDSGGA